MKKTISTLGSILLVLTLILSLGCGSNPVDYNNAIAGNINEIDQYFTALDSIVGEKEFNYDLYEKTRKEAIKKVAECKASINDLGALENDDTLQKAALDYMDGAKTLLENDWKTIGDGYKNFDDLSEDQYDTIVDLTLNIGEKTYDLTNNFSDVQEKFAKDHDYEIE